MSVRLPTAQEYALAVDKEHRWLPILARRVPLPIPVPLAKGEPDEGFAFHWSVNEWIDGDPAGIDTIGDLTGFAESLAAFLAALRHVDPTGGPEPGLHNWFRGGPLQVYDSQTRQAIAVLDGHLPRGHRHGDLAVGAAGGLGRPAGVVPRRRGAGEPPGS